MEQYDAMLSYQGGACAICRMPETMVRGGRVRRLSVDHDHATGLVRGLLCHACNVALGHFQEDALRIARFSREAPRYLVMFHGEVAA